MLDLVVAVLCAYRLTQLVVLDDVLNRPIDWLAQRNVWFSELVNCAHCAGVWCSALTAVLLYLMHIGWWPAKYVMYAAGLAGAVSILEHCTGWLTPRVVTSTASQAPMEIAERLRAVDEQMKLVQRLGQGMQNYAEYPKETLKEPKIVQALRERRSTELQELRDQKLQQIKTEHMKEE